jgi:hypothetical protein
MTANANLTSSTVTSETTSIDDFFKPSLHPSSYIHLLNDPIFLAYSKNEALQNTLKCTNSIFRYYQELLFLLERSHLEKNLLQLSEYLEKQQQQSETPAKDQGDNNNHNNNNKLKNQLKYLTDYRKCLADFKKNNILAKKILKDVQSVADSTKAAMSELPDLISSLTITMGNYYSGDLRKEDVSSSMTSNTFPLSTTMWMNSDEKSNLNNNHHIPNHQSNFPSSSSTIRGSSRGKEKNTQNDDDDDDDDEGDHSMGEVVGEEIPLELLHEFDPNLITDDDYEELGDGDDDDEHDQHDEGDVYALEENEY